MERCQVLLLLTLAALAGAESADRVRQVETAIGAVSVPADLPAAEADAALAPLTAAAAAAGVRGEGFALHRGLLVAWSLRREGDLIIPGGALRREAVAAPAAEVATGALAALAAATAGALPADLPAAAAQAIRGGLERLALVGAAGAPDAGADPALLRRMVASGWLERTLPGLGGATHAALRAACRAMMEPVAVERYRGSGGEIARWRSAEGGTWWTLRTAAECALLSDQPAADYAPPATARLRVRLGLPAAADPLHPADAEIAAATAVLADGADEIAAWSAQSGWRADARRWRARHPADARPGALPGALPPHLVVVDGWGSRRALIAAHGLLRMPAGAADADRFIADAARVLPDAPHLHLIGQQLFAYVYDSPDPRFPDLPSDRRHVGEIHQTAAQTIAGVAGGLLRGDCDDLAELYQIILAAQGRLPVIIGLPRHAACAWAEPAADGWTVHQLHTGPALASTAPTLPEALRGLWRLSDPAAPFDPRGIPLSLRFAGEDTRTRWQLGWRIFAEPDYARTMIAVQRAWYFRTYGHAIAAMADLVAAGDRDPANLRELAGLHTAIGSWDEAVRWQEQALAADGGAAQERYRLIGLLRRAGREERAAELAEAEAELLAAAPAEAATARLAIDLAETLAGDQAALRARLLQRHVLPLLAGDGPIAGLRSARHRAEFVRTAGRDAAALAMQIWQHAPAGAGDAAVREAIAFAQRWLDGPGFRSADRERDLDRMLCHAGWWAGQAIGHAMWSDMVAAEAPIAETAPAGARIGGLMQAMLDLPDLRRTPSWWIAEIDRDLHGTRPVGREPSRRDDERRWRPERIDRARLATHVRRLDEAMAVRRAAGGMHAADEPGRDLAHLEAALATGDRDGARAGLRRIADRGGRRGAESAAAAIGTYAAAWDGAGWQRLLDAWQETIDSKPYWLAIAWAAARAGNPVQAIACAERAGRRYADDPLIAAEARHLAGVLAGR